MAMDRSQLRFVTKPHGISTHQVRPGLWGLSEYLTYHTGQEHHVVHRLDRDTSGAMVFALTSQAAAEIAACFAKREVRKEYELVTTSAAVAPQTQCIEWHSQDDHIVVRSHIERQGPAFVSHTLSPANAETHFQLVRTEGTLSLWRARPITGRTHQIRLHAQALGLSILGDREHGGDPYPRMLLHASSLGVGEGDPFCSPRPRVMQDLSLLNDHSLSRALCAMERRHWLFAAPLSLWGGSDLQCWRYLHNDGENLRADHLGPVTFFYWYGAESPEKHGLDHVRCLAEQFGLGHWYLRWMKDRGSGIKELPQWQSSPSVPTTWTAQEAEMRFEFNGQTLSPGLFLDQRGNRQWLKSHCAGQSVLNLFCYTGGFSVAAALGGAHKVVSVDLSQAFLRWLKRNFVLNQIALEGHEFWAEDARWFLDRCHKKQRRFDKIICDPPSFGRGPRGVFQIEKHLPELITKMSNVLAPRGQILLSTNYEKWQQKSFEQVVQSAALPLGLKLSPAPLTEWDYELPGEDPLMKAVLLTSDGER